MLAESEVTTIDWASASIATYGFSPDPSQRKPPVSIARALTASRNGFGVRREIVTISREP